MPLTSKDFGWLDNYYIWDAITSGAFFGISQDEMYQIFNGWAPAGQDPAIALFESQSGVFTSLANLLYSGTEDLSAAEVLALIKSYTDLISQAVGTDNTSAPKNNLVIAGVQSNGTCQTVEVNASGHVNIADGGGSLTVDGTVTANAGTGNFTVVQATAANLNATVTGMVDVNSITGVVNVMPRPTNCVSGYTGAITNTTVTQVIAAQGIGKTLYVTQILVTNSHATVGTVVNIRDSSATVLYSGYAAPAGGGFTCSFATPLKLSGANLALEAVCLTTGSNIYVSANAYFV